MLSSEYFNHRNYLYYFQRFAAHNGIDNILDDRKKASREYRDLVDRFFPYSFRASSVALYVWLAPCHEPLAFEGGWTCLSADEGENDMLVYSFELEDDAVMARLHLGAGYS